MANLGAIGEDGSVSAQSIATPSGGVSKITAATRIVLGLGAWLGVYSPSTAVPALFMFKVQRTTRVFRP